METWGSSVLHIIRNGQRRKKYAHAGLAGLRPRRARRRSRPRDARRRRACVDPITLTAIIRGTSSAVEEIRRSIRWLSQCVRSEGTRDRRKEHVSGRRCHLICSSLVEVVYVSSTASRRQRPPGRDCPHADAVRAQQEGTREQQRQPHSIFLRPLYT
ncbi:hypothetical protein M432DRAFT_75857 [Thermoascus aurantiacus ATCC 26904]